MTATVILTTANMSRTDLRAANEYLIGRLAEVAAERDDALERAEVAEAENAVLQQQRDRAQYQTATVEAANQAMQEEIAGLEQQIRHQSVVTAGIAQKRDALQVLLDQERQRAVEAAEPRRSALGPRIGNIF
jgi:chromosome segregation ATPase